MISRGELPVDRSAEPVHADLSPPFGAPCRAPPWLRREYSRSCEVGRTRVLTGIKRKSGVTCGRAVLNSRSEVGSRPCAGRVTWRPSRPGRARGSRGADGRRGSPRGPARSAAIRRTSGCGSARRRAQARRRRARARRGATAPARALRVERRRALGGGRAGRQRMPGCAARRAPRAAARAPNTKHSVSELEASRLAPCRPVHEHSPTAYRPGSVARPSRSVAIPPIM